MGANLDEVVESCHFVALTSTEGGQVACLQSASHVVVFREFRDVCVTMCAHLVVRLVATGQLFSSGCFATTRGRAGLGNIMAPVTAATGKFIDIAAGAGHTLAVTTAGASPVRGRVCGTATLMPSLLAHWVLSYFPLRCSRARQVRS